ncbi:MAG: hypothetical protein WC365_02050 [Candidatus Babeliales bacterium]
MTQRPVRSSISFGTDGVRGRADAFPFTDEALVALGYAVGQWAREVYAKDSPVIALGADTRISGERIKRSLGNGLILAGACVRDVGVLSTPGIYEVISGGKICDASISISASHNPYEDNGIKLFDSRRCKITVDDEQKIIRAFEQCIGRVVVTRAQELEKWPEAAAWYVQHIVAQFRPLFLRNVKVVLDCAHGAAYVVAPEIFRALGATVISMADAPDGTNINYNCGSVHPEELARRVCAEQADCGFAFDGDADRVIAVSRTGVIKDGDDILAMLLKLPAYQSLSHVVGTLFTNQGFEEYLCEQGKHLFRTKVGEKYVAAKLEEEGLPLGGEVSGHIITRDYAPTGDGIFVALRVLESIIHHNNWDMITFQKFPQVLANVRVTHKPDLALQPYAALIAEYERNIGKGRIVVRYSGTEPLLRVMTEASTYEKAQQVAHDLAQALKNALETSQ